MIKWRFLNTDYGSPAWNMAVDEALMRLCTIPTLRVFRWQPSTISFGYGQEIEKEIDFAACERLNIGYVRRPTGGRAVLHADELTYSMTARETDDLIGRKVMETYALLSKGLVKTLHLLGVEEAELEKSTPSANINAANPCFTSAGRYEICVQGRKIIGSAQRRTGGHVLQHGSFLLGSAHLQLIDCIPNLTDDQRHRLHNVLRQKTVDLASVLGRMVDFDDVASTMKTAFQEVLHIEFDDGQLTNQELELAQELNEKYASEDWNWRRKPSPTF